MEFPKQQLPSYQQMNIPSCLSIAGSDSGGEAGIQADLQAFLDYQVHGLTAITATTAQNPDAISQLGKTSAENLEAQISAVDNYFKPQFIKTGLICDLDQLSVVNKYIETKTCIVDPVIKATSGKKFLGSETHSYFINSFLKKVFLITPNWDEIKWLLNSTSDDLSLLLRQAQTLSKDKGMHLFLKGGHSRNPSTDFLITKDKILKYSCEEIKIESSHGTGCRISSAICAGLSLNLDVEKSCKYAKNYVAHCLKNTGTTNGKSVMKSPGNFRILENLVNYEEINL
ncbi:MAG: hydroxymethylpyrimidine/phosphomethylpyrimidine kinase [Lentisphaeraceae bacterium]|nr:hydroxymethylpyrimidine/phosphomethylpyrimidine kinase [Lentisphaeraceae bacterium]